MYQVLYRKWRPQTFSDVYGQPHVTTALKNEMRTGRLAHAYLFTGSRGTGKTSCAKILAKAVNCLRPADGDPCNECDVCRGIDDGTILDVVEIDAASNNGVDNIRDLREEVNFTPAVAKYRVYIIDEVHMLSAGAFNALLKTLEEPPAHVIFILATTEVHKLPATILSRCQRFDFSRIRPEDIAARLRCVAQGEGFDITDGAALLIARLSDGGMRDALSLLDQCVSRAPQADGRKSIDEDTVSETAGIAGRDHLFALSQAMRQGDGAAALALIDRLHGASLDMERLCAEWIDFFRGLMILKSVPEPDDLIVAAPAEIARMKEEAAQFDLPAILHAMTVLQHTLERLRGGVSRRVEMEMAALRLCAPELDTGAEALLRRVQALENAVRAGVRTASPTQPTTPPASQPARPTASADVAPPPEEAPPPRETEAPQAETPFDRWGDVLEALASQSPPLYGVLAGSSAFLRGDMLLICTENEMFRSLVGRDGNKNVLAGAIRQVTGKTYRIGLKKVQTDAARPEEPADPLTAFLRSSRELGVDVHVRD